MGIKKLSLSEYQEYLLKLSKLTGFTPCGAFSKDNVDYLKYTVEGIFQITAIKVIDTLGYDVSFFKIANSAYDTEYEIDILCDDDYDGIVKSLSEVSDNFGDLEQDTNFLLEAVKKTKRFIVESIK